MSKWREIYKVFPAADVFPMMSDDELAKLGEDIKANGLHEPVTFMDGDDGEKILLDGRNRLEAAERAGARYWERGVIIGNGDPVAFIISANIRRRHLTKQQQADLIIAVHKAAERKPRTECEVSKGGRGKVDTTKAAIVASAKEHGIGKRTVEKQLAAHEKATDHPNAPPNLRRKVKAQAKRDEQKRKLSEFPSTIHAARSLYFKFCASPDVDLDAEMEIIVDGLQEIAGRRAMASRGAGLR